MPTERSLAQRLGLFAAGTAVGVGAAVAVALRDPETPGQLPGCPLYAVTGLWCPACGGLRAAHALAHGDVLTALERNPLILVFVGFALWVWWRRARQAWTGTRWVGVSSNVTMRLVLPLLLLFTVLRNVPGWTWLSPA